MNYPKNLITYPNTQFHTFERDTFFYKEKNPDTVFRFLERDSPPIRGSSTTGCTQKGDMTMTTNETQQVFAGMVVPDQYEIWKDGLYYRRLGIDHAIRTHNMRSANATCATAALTLADIGGRVPKSDQVCPQIRQEVCRMVRVAGQYSLQSSAEDLDSGDWFYELRFLKRGDWCSIWVPAIQLFSKFRASQLNRHGFTLVDGKSKLFTEYNNLLTLCNQIQHKRICSRHGWIDEAKNGETKNKDDRSTGWLIGNRYVQVRGSPIYPQPKGMTNGPAFFDNAFVSVGDYESWRKKEVQLIRAAQDPITARWLIDTGFAGPLVRQTRSRSFIVHHWGETSGGKSLLGRFGASVWGDPNKFMINLNATIKGITSMVRQVSDFTLVLDEIQAMEERHNSKAIRQMVYQIATGQGRIRLNSNGSFADPDVLREHKAIIRITGEQPLIPLQDVTESGDSNRFIQIRSDVLDSKTAAQFHSWLDLREAQGVAGIRFLRLLKDFMLSVPEDHLFKMRLSIQEDIAAKVGASTGTQWTMHLAVVALAHILRRWLPLDEHERDLHFDKIKRNAINDAAHIWDQMEIVGRRRPWDLFIEQVKNSWESDPNRWIREQDGATRWTRDAAGVIPDPVTNPGEVVWIFPDKFKSLSLKNDLSPDRVLFDLQRVGMLPDARKTEMRKLSWSKESIAVYVIRDKVEEQRVNNTKVN